MRIDEVLCWQVSLKLAQQVEDVSMDMIWVVGALETRRDHLKEKMQYCAPWQQEYREAAHMLRLVEHLLTTMDSNLVDYDNLFSLDPYRQQDPANEP